MKTAILHFVLSLMVIQGVWAGAEPQAIWGMSPIAEPYTYVSKGRFVGPAIAESPDPLVTYRWPDPKAADALEIFLLKPRRVSADPADAFVNVQSLTQADPNVLVTGTGSIRLDLIAPVKIVNRHAGGTYVVYTYDKSVKFRLNKVRGDIVSLSGLFFDPVRPGLTLPGDSE